MKKKKSKNTTLEMMMIIYGAIGLIGLLIVCIMFAVKGKYNVADTSDTTVTEDNNGFIAGDAVTGSSTSDEDSLDLTATSEDESVEVVDESDADDTDADETTDLTDSTDTEELIADAESVLDDDLSMDTETEEEIEEEETEPVYTFKVQDTLARPLNVRSLPSADSEKLGTLPQGTEGTIDERGDEWSLIEANGLVGYVKNDYINVFDEDGNQIAGELPDGSLISTDSQETN